MAQPTRPGRVQKTPVYAYDPYNFSHVTTTSGTNPAITIPTIGIHAIGATQPTSTRTVVAVEVTVIGTNPNPGYGNNFGTPPP